MTPPEIVEMNFRHKNGNICNVEISLGKIDYQGAEAMLISVRDITERKQTQKKLEKLYEQERKLRASLQEEIEKRSKYTRALVHELNTPLTAILASGELLESEIEDETLMALVKNIRRSSNNLKQRIEELIELARGEIGLLKINAVPLKIRELLQEIGSEMEPLARHKGLEFKVETGELPEVKGDHERLKQVVLNLVSNALKYTQQGKIEIGAEVKGATVEVRVQDSGRGIGEDEMENLFDPYRRKGNEGQELSGLGIGLALSKMIVESHGGKISVESQKDKGSIFRFTVPILHK
jgi:signal transduction histidine kinase